MDSEELPTDNSRLLTFDERVQLRKKILRMNAKMQIGIPFIGTSLIVILIIFLVNYNVSDKIIEIVSYACSVSLLWLIIGIFRYVSYRMKLPPIKE